MQEVIRALRAEGKTIIFSTHIRSEAERLCDTIAFVHKGRVLASGSLDEHRRATGMHYLEDIFVHHVRDGSGAGRGSDGAPPQAALPHAADTTPPHGDPLADPASR